MRRYLVGNQEGNVRTYLFVFLQIILYMVFLTLDFIGNYNALSAYIKFSTIILCFCYVFFFGENSDRGTIFCMRAAMFFTLVSDLFLLMLDYYIYGLITFIIVQQLYGIRLILADHRTMKKLILRIFMQIAAALAVCLILYLAGVMIETLLLISIFYFICIISNTVSAVLSAVCNPRNRSNVLFAAGMVLFLLCDINVGIFNMSGFITLPEKLSQMLYSISSILMWTFYTPAQVIIALSTSRKRIPGITQPVVRG